MNQAVLSPVRGHRWIRRALAVVLPLALLNGCSTMSNTDKGVAAGAGLGAATGALIGSATHNTGVGAVAGAALGAIGGGLIGHGIDESEKKTDAKIAAAQAVEARRLGLTDIAQMAQQHISDEVIITQIRTTGSVFTLSATDIQWLKENGVSDRVVIEMQATASRAHVYAPTAVYVAEPPPPPVGFGVGVGYSRGFR
jgi:outer membrane lipoprotein SlyB